MRLITFDPYRTLGLSEASYIKPELLFRHRDDIRVADWLLFPQYWQVNVLHYAWGRRIFPNINTYHLGHDKVEMTRAFEAVAPAHVPWTLIRPATDAAVEEVLDTFGFPFVAKEVRNSMGRGVHLIENRRQFLEYAGRNDVLYAQEYLSLESDLRVVWVGDRVASAYWRDGGDGFHHNVARGARMRFDDIPAEALQLVEEVARALGIDHAGFDVARVDGHYYLLEFNVLFGLDGLNRQGIKPAQLVLDYLHRSGGDEPGPDDSYPPQAA